MTVSSAGHAYFALKDERNQLQCVWFRDDRDALGVRGPGRAARRRARPDRPVRAARARSSSTSSRSSRRASATSRSSSRRSRHGWRPRGCSTRPASGPCRPARRRSPSSRARPARSGGTSATCSARRWPLVQVVLVAAQVQGEAAPASLVTAFRRVERYAATCREERPRPRRARGDDPGPRRRFARGPVGLQRRAGRARRGGPSDAGGVRRRATRSMSRWPTSRPTSGRPRRRPPPRSSCPTGSRWPPRCDGPPIGSAAATARRLPRPRARCRGAPGPRPGQPGRPPGRGPRAGRPPVRPCHARRRGPARRGALPSRRRGDRPAAPHGRPAGDRAGALEAAAIALPRQSGIRVAARPVVARHGCDGTRRPGPSATLDRGYAIVRREPDGRIVRDPARRRPARGCASGSPAVTSRRPSTMRETPSIGELLVFVVLVAVIAIVGVGVGMLVAPRLGALSNGSPHPRMRMPVTEPTRPRRRSTSCRSTTPWPSSSGRSPSSRPGPPLERPSRSTSAARPCWNAARRCSAARSCGCASSWPARGPRDRRGRRGADRRRGLTNGPPGARRNLLRRGINYHSDCPAAVRPKPQ